MKTMSLISVAALALMLSACGDSGDAFVGKWVSAKNECSTLEVAKDGSNYLAKIDSPGFLARERISVPGVLKDGVLSVALPGGAKSLVVDKNTGSLLVGSAQYHRATGKEKNCYPEK